MKQAASTMLWMGSVEHKDNNELSYAERSSKKYNMESKRGQSIHLILIFLKKKRKKKGQEAYPNRKLLPWKYKFNSKFNVAITKLKQS